MTHRIVVHKQEYAQVTPISPLDETQKEISVSKTCVSRIEFPKNAPPRPPGVYPGAAVEMKFHLKNTQQQLRVVTSKKSADIEIDITMATRTHSYVFYRVVCLWIELDLLICCVAVHIVLFQA